MQSWLSSFLKMGITFAVFIFFGKSPESSDRLNIWVTGMANVLLNLFKTRFGILKRPTDFLMLINFI